MYKLNLARLRHFLEWRREACNIARYKCTIKITRYRVRRVKLLSFDTRRVHDKENVDLSRVEGRVRGALGARAALSNQLLTSRPPRAPSFSEVVANLDELTHRSTDDYRRIVDGIFQRQEYAEPCDQVCHKFEYTELR